MQETCIIIPCFNEEKRLDFSRFTNFIEGNLCHFYFVNDGSEDNTLRLLEKLQELFPEKVKVLELSHNVGKAEAVRKGILSALDTESFAYIGFFDADLATPLEEIDFLLNYLKAETKIVIGSRVKRLGSSILRTPSRHYMGRVFATFASLLLDIKVYDSQCGAKFFEKDTAKTLFLEPFVSKWLFDLEIIFRFKKLNPVNFDQEIIEVPLRSWSEKKGSKLKLTDIAKAPVELFKIRGTA